MASSAVTITDPKTGKPHTKINSEAIDIFAEPSKPAFKGSRSPGLGPIERDPFQDPISRMPGLSDIEVATPESEALDKLNATARNELDLKRDLASADIDVSNFIAAARFGLNVMNANSAYASVEFASAMRIQDARRQAQDAREQGQQRFLEEQVEGQLAGDQAALALAAQGQDVSGLDVEKVRSSYQDIGIYNGLKAEMDAIREVLGFELQEVTIDYELDMAELQRQSTILAEGLNLGATVASNKMRRDALNTSIGASSL